MQFYLSYFWWKSSKTHGLLILLQSSSSILKAVSINCWWIISRAAALNCFIFCAPAAPPHPSLFAADRAGGQWVFSVFFICIFLYFYTFFNCVCLLYLVQCAPPDPGYSRFNWLSEVLFLYFCFALLVIDFSFWNFEFVVEFFSPFVSCPPAEASYDCSRFKCWWSEGVQRMQAKPSWAQIITFLWHCTSF